MSSITRIEVAISTGSVFGDTNMDRVDEAASLQNLEDAYLAALGKAYPAAAVMVERTYDAGQRSILAHYANGDPVEGDALDTLHEITGRCWDGGAWIVEVA